MAENKWVSSRTPTAHDCQSPSPLCITPALCFYLELARTAYDDGELEFGGIDDITRCQHGYHIDMNIREYDAILLRMQCHLDEREYVYDDTPCERMPFLRLPARWRTGSL